MNSSSDTSHIVLQFSGSSFKCSNFSSRLYIVQHSVKSLLQQTKKGKEKRRKKSFHGGNNSHELNYGIAPLSSNLKQGLSLGGRKQSICTHLGFHHLYTKLLLDLFFWACFASGSKTPEQLGFGCGECRRRRRRFSCFFRR